MAVAQATTRNEHLGDGTPSTIESEARQWRARLAPYQKPRLARSLAELAVTALPFLSLWLLMWLSLGYAYWLCLLLALPASAFLLRLFMIQHDCGHGAFFGAAMRQ